MKSAQGRAHANRRRGLADQPYEKHACSAFRFLTWLLGLRCVFQCRSTSVPSASPRLPHKRGEMLRIWKKIRDLCAWGTWCSGITPAQHAGGPGFNPQCVHFWFPFCSYNCLYVQLNNPSSSKVLACCAQGVQTLHSFLYA